MGVLKTQRGAPVATSSRFLAGCGVGFGMVQTRRCGSSAKGLGMPKPRIFGLRTLPNSEHDDARSMFVHNFGETYTTTCLITGGLEIMARGTAVRKITHVEAVRHS